MAAENYTTKTPGPLYFFWTILPFSRVYQPACSSIALFVNIEQSPSLPSPPSRHLTPSPLPTSTFFPPILLGEGRQSLQFYERSRDPCYAAGEREREREIQRERERENVREIISGWAASIATCQDVCVVFFSSIAMAQRDRVWPRRWKTVATIFSTNFYNADTEKMSEKTQQCINTA